MALVSVVIPVHDRDSFIDASLDSIERQGYMPLEAIVVDDGSSDRSAAIATPLGHPLHPYRPRRSGARATSAPPQLGATSPGLDADDMWTDVALATRIDYLEQHPSLDFVTGKMVGFTEPDDLPQRPVPGRWTSRPSATWARS